MKYRVRYMSVHHPLHRALDSCPSAGPHPNVTGMKKLYWGIDAKCVRSGAYVYNVTSKPELYERAK